MKAPRVLSPDELRRVIESIGEIAAGKLISMPVGTSQTKLAHGLGRIPRGWIEVSPGADAVQETAAPDIDNIYVSCATAKTPKLWVF